MAERQKLCLPTTTSLRNYRYQISLYSFTYRVGQAGRKKTRHCWVWVANYPISIPFGTVLSWTSRILSGQCIFFVCLFFNVGVQCLSHPSYRYTFHCIVPPVGSLPIKIRSQLQSQYHGAKKCCLSLRFSLLALLVFIQNLYENVNKKTSSGYI